MGLRDDLPRQQKRFHCRSVEPEPMVEPETPVAQDPQMELNRIPEAQRDLQKELWPDTDPESESEPERKVEPEVAPSARPQSEVLTSVPPRSSSIPQLATNSTPLPAVEEVYKYALRTAYLADLLSARPAEPLRPTTLAAPPPLKHASSSRTEKFLKLGRDAPDKFPSAAGPPLKYRIQRIAKGTDLEFKDEALKMSLSAFGKKLDENDFLKKFNKRDGKVEELILIFGQVATTTLRESHAAEDLMATLDLQMGAFIRILKESIRGLGGAEDDLIATLDSHLAKLSAAKPASTAGLRRAPVQVSEMATVLLVGDLFGKTTNQLEIDIGVVKKVASERAAYLDVKLCLNNLAVGEKFPGSRNDFDSDDAFQEWKKRENADLSEMLKKMIARDSSLLPLRADSDTTLTFVPPEPKLFYQRLLDVALDQANHDEEGVELVSTHQRAVLDACALRWRLMPSVQPVYLLGAVSAQSQQGSSSVESVVSALSALEEAEERFHYDTWPWAERLRLFQTLHSLFDALLPRLLTIYDGDFEKSVGAALERVYANEVFQEDARDLKTSLDAFEIDLRARAKITFDGRRGTATSPPSVDLLVALSSWVLQEVALLTKRFRHPVLGRIDLPAIFVSVAVPEWMDLLEASRPSILSAPEEALRQLYEAALSLKSVHLESSPKADLRFDVAVFAPLVWKFFDTVIANLRKWLPEAIEKDRKGNFQADLDSEDKQTSSIMDLTDMCLQIADNLFRLDWPDEVENARHVSELSLRISQCIGRYGFLIDEMFTADLFPQTDDADLEEQPSTWLVKAKQAIATNSSVKINPFSFTPQMLVKLNDVQAARKFLETTMFTKLKGERMAQLVEQNPLPNPPPRRHLFIVKVVRTERLQPAEGDSLNAFVVLSDQGARRVISKTRTQFQTDEPRWSQGFDIPVSSPITLEAAVLNRRPGDGEGDDLLGIATLQLNPSEFTARTRDVWVQLKDSRRRPTPSRLLLRISVDVEKDTVPFYLGRTSRILLRTEKEMAKSIVSKMLPFIRGCLSQANLQALVTKKITLEEQIDKAQKTVAAVTARVDWAGASTKLTDLWKDTFDDPNRELIPEVKFPELKPKVDPNEAENKRVALIEKDREFEDTSLAPLNELLNYLYSTFVVLTESLCREAWDLVMNRIWKEILNTVEALILPPLSDLPTSMRPLTELEIRIVYIWLQALMKQLHGEGHGLPMTVLQSPRYLELALLPMIYHNSTDSLCEDAVRSMQRRLIKKDSEVGRNKSVYRRNLGTLRARKGRVPKPEKAEEVEGLKCEAILRILRMRPGTGDFLSMQIRMLQAHV
ncbi:C2 domain protein [Pseudohyphozyma bogoriensis]|nr:C2 domain protein [Pseudohyphozyma bogoriensis]